MVALVEDVRNWVGWLFPEAGVVSGNCLLMTSELRTGASRHLHRYHRLAHADIGLAVVVMKVWKGAVGMT